VQDKIFAKLCYRFVNRVVYLSSPRQDMRGAALSTNDYSTRSSSPLDVSLSRDLFCSLNHSSPFDCIVRLGEF